MGKDFAKFNSGSSPGTKQFSWGLKGDSGKLFDSGESSILYGAKIANDMTLGCGFLIKQNDSKEQDEEKKEEMSPENNKKLLTQIQNDSKVFFTYNGVKSELYRLFLKVYLNYFFF